MPPIRKLVAEGLSFRNARSRPNRHLAEHTTLVTESRPHGTARGNNFVDRARARRSRIWDPDLDKDEIVKAHRL